MPCVPRISCRTRTKRRPNAELHARIARCEELVQHFVDSRRAKPGQLSSGDHGHRQQKVEPEEAAQPSAAALGKLVLEEGSVRFTDSLLWATVSEEVNQPHPYNYHYLTSIPPFPPPAPINEDDHRDRCPRV